MLSTWAFHVRLDDIVIPSILHVVTLAISLPSTLILGISTTVAGILTKADYHCFGFGAINLINMVINKYVGDVVY